MPSAGITRMTSQRRVILEELAKVATHPTADELYQQVRRRLPRISLGTVYRNLEVLASAGKVSKVCPADRQRRFGAVPASALPHPLQRMRTRGRRILAAGQTPGEDAS